ncbi:MAG: DUF4838 domain-containing protein, partial [Clostridia bacterium]|nr:DUF4838 domain-containing protein [Clostridia bacterium]
MIIDAKNLSDYGLLYDKSDAGLTYAAEHINEYFYKCDGLKFADYNGQKHFISIGNNDKSKCVIAANPIGEDKYDGYRICFDDGNIYIFGNYIRATVYGVYAFIEKFMGVRWFHKDAELTPRFDALNIEEKDIFEWAYFPQRELTYHSFSTDWELAMHFRFFSYNVKENPAVGQVNNWYKKIPTSHNTHCYVDFEKYKTKPHLFRVRETETSNFDPFANGVGARSIDLCYSNGITADGKFDESMEESAAREVANKLFEFINEDPKNKFFMYGLQDNRGVRCFCPECKKKREKYGTEAGVVIIFLNAVIEKVEKMLIAAGKTPDFNVAMFAYHNTVEPPTKDGKPIDNLIIPHKRLHIRYAPIDADYTYSLADDRQGETIKRQIRGWTAITKNMMFWDYNVNFMEQFWYFPILPNIKENIRFYAKTGITYLFGEGSDDGTANWQQEIFSYVMSKLFWNCDIDVWETTKEYVYGFYGLAAEKVMKFINTMQAFFEKKIADGMKITIVKDYADMFKPEYYPLEFLVEQCDLIKSAIADIRASSLNKMQKKEYIIRLKRVLATPLRMISKNAEYYFGDDEDEYTEQFYEIAREVQLTSIGSGPYYLNLADGDG